MEISFSIPSILAHYCCPWAGVGGNDGSGVAFGFKDFGDGDFVVVQTIGRHRPQYRAVGIGKVEVDPARINNRSSDWHGRECILQPSHFNA